MSEKRDRILVTVRGGRVGVQVRPMEDGRYECSYDGTSPTNHQDDPAVLLAAYGHGETRQAAIAAYVRSASRCQF